MAVTLDLEKVNKELRGRTAEEILRWAAATFGDRLALQSSMQKTAGVLMHMISRIAPQTEIIFVDTGVHFPETLDTRDEFIRRYGLKIRSCAPRMSFDAQHEQFGRYLHEHDDARDGSRPGYLECCRLRKEVPFLDAVKGRFDAVVSGLTRAEGGARRHIALVSWDARFEGYKIHPLADWTEEQIDDYTREHDLPVHPLYARGYRSIGCWTCTTPVQPGEHPRAGRWRHLRAPAGEGEPFQPRYCGINLEDKQGD